MLTTFPRAVNMAFVEALINTWQRMGWGAYPMALWLLITTVLVIERTCVLYIGSSAARSPLVSALKLAILGGDIGSAAQQCARSRAPFARATSKGLAVLRESPSMVQGEVDVAALRETAALSARVAYLPVLANLAVLTGILSTMTGLVRSPCCFCPDDPGARARILAEGISEALVCTAAGLAIAIVSLCAYALLKARSQRLNDELSALTVQLLNLALVQRGAQREVPHP